MVSPAEVRDYLLNLPALEPPPNVQANFVDPPIIRSQMLGVIISMLVLSTIAVAVRLYTKLVVIKILALEDCKHLPLSLGNHLTIHIDLIASAWVRLVSASTYCISANTLVLPDPLRRRLPSRQFYLRKPEGARRSSMEHTSKGHHSGSLRESK